MEELRASDPDQPNPLRSRSWRWRLWSGFASTLVGLAFVAAMGAGVAVLHLRAASEALPQRPSPTPVSALQLKIEDSYEETWRYVGRLEPARQTALAFERGGLVTQVAKDEGHRVSGGELIARLDTVQLEAHRNQLEAQVRELEAKRRLAELTLGRQSKLQKKGWSPEQRLDEAEAAVVELKSAIDRVNAQIASVDIDIAKSRLTAPFDGTVSGRAIDEGAVVAAGTPILSVLETGRRQARIGLPPHVAAGLDPASEFTLEAEGGVLTARLVARRPDLQAATRTVTALFEVTGPAEVPFGDVVTLALKTRIEQSGAWVPLASLSEGYRGLWNLMTIEDGPNPQPVVRRAVVEVLHVEGERAFVRGTFEPGSKVVAAGSNRVTAGQRVVLARE